ncbi:MAG: poly-gamma-glutamate system protein [Ignavibacteriales bacterium]|nr:MAG: poly-gamma-glutamate system protein [Ignavibacteriales bacterium]
MKKDTILRLSFLFAASLTVYLIVLFSAEKGEADEYSEGMLRAEVLSRRWLTSADSLARAVRGRDTYPVYQEFGGLIGPEYSEITTTTGTLDAKITSLNPCFAALIYKWLKEAEIDSSSAITLQISGSFPALAISALAALQVSGARVSVMSSIGASMYGANDTLFPWPAIEKHLTEECGLLYKSSIMTSGGDDERGEGIPFADTSIFFRLAERHGFRLYIPEDLNAVLSAKLDLIRKSGSKMYINIGGSHSALGNCSHILQVRPGFHRQLQSCKDPLRGLLFRASEEGLPVIHLLNIRELALQYGFPIAPSEFNKKPDKLIAPAEYPKLYIYAGIVMITLLAYALRIKKLNR